MLIRQNYTANRRVLHVRRAHNGRKWLMLLDTWSEMFLQTVSVSCLLQATQLRPIRAKLVSRWPTALSLLVLLSGARAVFRLTVPLQWFCAWLCPPLCPALPRKLKAVEKDPVATSTDNLALTLTLTLTPLPVAVYQQLESHAQPALLKMLSRLLPADQSHHGPPSENHP